ncbi:MAG: vancomycin high temperature exclusion protein [Geitlerinemataceae cyanobacterium]
MSALLSAAVWWLSRGAIGAAIALLLVVWGIGWHVRHTTRAVRFGPVADVPAQPVAIVFGAGVYADGTPTPMLADRVRAGIALYQAGKVERLLMSGDNRVPEYNEVAAMQNFAIARGVPAEAIAVDRFGLNTFATCDRARREFGIDRATLVTQNYHLPRAVYLCRALGIDAVGFGVRDWGVYTYSGMAEYSLRESIATVKAWWQVRRSPVRKQ